MAARGQPDLDLGAGRGIALREVPLKTGPCDYLLLVDRRPVGVIEAKKVGTTLSGVADQSANYGNALPDFLTALVPSAQSTPRQFCTPTIPACCLRVSSQPG